MCVCALPFGPAYRHTTALGCLGICGAIAARDAKLGWWCKSAQGSRGQDAAHIPGRMAFWNHAVWLIAKGDEVILIARGPFVINGGRRGEWVMSWRCKVGWARAPKSTAGLLYLLRLRPPLQRLTSSGVHALQAASILSNALTSESRH